MLLCKTAIGTPNELIHSDSSITLARLPKGTHSTKGVGRNIPDPKGDIKYDDCTLATGKILQNQNLNKNGGSLFGGSIFGLPSLLYNEFIVYDVEQVEMRYLFKIKV